LGRVIPILLFSAFFILVDLYVFQAVKSSIQGMSVGWIRSISIAFWAITGLSIIGLIYVNNYENVSRDLRRYVIVGVSLIYFSKVFGVLTLLIDDIFRAGQWVFYKIFPSRIEESVAKEGITRSEFMSKASLIAVAVPMATFSFGIASGAHNYRLRKRTIYLPNLPRQFDGITIGQLSDIHSGSFF
jgi:hypothetical protein